ncbi:SDR family oxidoreductase [Paenibacillus cellulositrophicus]|uniref:3-ketoacyl-ACP reductase n=3 Tax=Paenibacillus TaxID=44249 RepID=A0A1R1EZ27_9BACL|nr:MULTISPECIES: SDR family oxidoreductase [Paenibacillus]MBJ9992951.1 SDR family oxidoreductase [Paenibacillus sp. S28]OMF57058.1 3-ketoacyl-ACP reductase [Paenibacillus rhizosphaerae]OXL84261.1 3-ketoacyl-ACP reductase [Paenibacillus sp. SSG-1]RED39916.1 NAD(P)-dependent dehydrogenase (short-subunit alcohol dehydrogenase family) [Paenibacillus sp. VMFN-D1]UYO02191.1 SDR family oxidoreductase [Paenibacillus sp. PSB04]
MKLQDKVTVITGAGSGMGKEMALLFAKEGAKLVLADISQASLDQVVAEIQQQGGTAVGVIANVAKEEDVQNMIDTAVNQYGSLDVLVNNAGIMDKMVAAAEVTDELWERVFAVNTTGPMRAIRKALPIMVKQGKGVIVNTASVGGLFGSRAGAAYTASKHAVIGLTKNVGYQYAKLGIRCNAIAPGGVETNIMSDTPSMDMNALGVQQAMAGMGVNPRTGKPDEIAKVALFLASDDSSFVNGTVITADAGWTAY